MKSFKKGIALLAVLAFLITAMLPVAGLASEAAPTPATIVATPATGGEGIKPASTANSSDSSGVYYMFDTITLSTSGGTLTTPGAWKVMGPNNENVTVSENKFSPTVPGTYKIEKTGAEPAVTPLEITVNWRIDFAAGVGTEGASFGQFVTTQKKYVIGGTDQENNTFGSGSTDASKMQWVAVKKDSAAGAFPGSTVDTATGRPQGVTSGPLQVSTSNGSYWTFTQGAVVDTYPVDKAKNPIDSWWTAATSAGTSVSGTDLGEDLSEGTLTLKPTSAAKLKLEAGDWFIACKITGKSEDNAKDLTQISGWQLHVTGATPAINVGTGGNATAPNGTPATDADVTIAVPRTGAITNNPIGTVSFMPEGAKYELVPTTAGAPTNATLNPTFTATTTIPSAYGTNTMTLTLALNQEAVDALAQAAAANGGQVKYTVRALNAENATLANSAKNIIFTVDPLVALENQTIYTFAAQAFEVPVVAATGSALPVSDTTYTLEPDTTTTATGAQPGIELTASATGTPITVTGGIAAPSTGTLPTGGYLYNIVGKQDGKVVAQGKAVVYVYTFAAKEGTQTQTAYAGDDVSLEGTWQPAKPPEAAKVAYAWTDKAPGDVVAFEPASPTTNPATVKVAENAAEGAYQFTCTPTLNNGTPSSQALSTAIDFTINVKANDVTSVDPVETPIQTDKGTVTPADTTVSNTPVTDDTVITGGEITSAPDGSLTLTLSGIKDEAGKEVAVDPTNQSEFQLAEVTNDIDETKNSVIAVEVPPAAAGDAVDDTITWYNTTDPDAAPTRVEASEAETANGTVVSMVPLEETAGVYEYTAVAQTKDENGDTTTKVVVFQVVQNTDLEEKPAQVTENAAPVPVSIDPVANAGKLPENAPNDTAGSAIRYRWVASEEAIQITAPAGTKADNPGITVVPGEVWTTKNTIDIAVIGKLTGPDPGVDVTAYVPGLGQEWSTEARAAVSATDKVVAVGAGRINLNNTATYTVTPSISGNGTVFINGTDVTDGKVINAAAGETITVSTVPGIAGQFASITVKNGAGKTIATGDSSVSFTMPADAVTVAVVFATRPLTGSPTNYYYDIQSPEGYFLDAITTPNIPRPQYPLGKDLVIEKTPGTAGVTNIGTNDGTSLKVNDRVVLRYDVNADPKVPASANGYEYEWVYRTSQAIPGGGDALTITQPGFSGVNSPTLVIAPVTANMDGWVFQLRISPAGASNASGNYYVTPWVTLNIDGVNTQIAPEATITSYPKAVGSTVTIPETGNVTFTANVQQVLEDYASLTYQWQSAPAPTVAAPSPTFTNMDGETNKTLTITNAAKALNGTQYRCVVRNTSYIADPEGITPALTLNVTDPSGAVIIETPTSESLLHRYAGRTVTTSVTARTDNGNPVAYQWYVQQRVQDPPIGDRAITTIGLAQEYLGAAGSQPLTGQTNPTLTTEALEPGVYHFTCRVTNADNAQAQPVLTPGVYVVVTRLSRKPTITEPATKVNVNVGVANGQNITLPCKAYVASGETLSYQWQQLAPNQDINAWTNLGTGTSADLVLTGVPTEYTGMKFRCIVTNTASKEQTTSGTYTLSVWDVAEVPVVGAGNPQNQIMNYADVPAIASSSTSPLAGNKAVTLSSTATIPQGLEGNSDVHFVYAAWFKDDNTMVAALPVILTGWSPSTPGNPYYIEITSTENASGQIEYTSTLQISIPEPAKNGTRPYNGNYHCVWFNSQTALSDSELEQAAGLLNWTSDGPANDNPTPAGAWIVPPQAASGTADVQIWVNGDPRITVPSSNQTAAVGQTASFSIGAIPEGGVGTLVYTWQMTSDGADSVTTGNLGGKTWKNCLSSDGTGQFTNTFTTIPITQEMYDRATASNVKPDYNAATVYRYRCIISNRATGARVITPAYNLTITPGNEPTPEEPTITPAEGSEIHIEGTGDNRYATGLTVSKEGTTLKDFLDELGYIAPAGYTLKVVGSDDVELTETDNVYTGCKIQLVKNSDETIVDQATIIVTGDVLGAKVTDAASRGTVTIAQVVAMAKDLNGAEKLEGIYALAGDFNGSGPIDIADLVAEAKILNETIDVM